MSSQHTTVGWARAFIAALAATTADPAIWDQGQRLLATGPAGPLNVNQGFATSKFPLPEGRVARPRLVVDELSAGEWERIETTIAARPDAVAVAGTAAISDQLADPTHTAGIPLIPGPQDITHTCTCTPTTTDTPCAHTVAVGFLLAERLRTAPAPLFTLRGRAHHHLKKRLRVPPAPAGLRGAALPAPTSLTPATPASRPAIPAQSTKRVVPIPEPADLDLDGLRPVLTGPLAPPPAPLPDIPAMGTLTADAAHRAGLLLDTNELPVCPDVGSDLARLVALPHGAPLRQATMDYLGLDLVGMGHLSLAYAYGGPAGATTYLKPLTVDHDILARAQAAIQPLRPAPMATVECENNRLTDHAAGIQLRYGPDGRWYPYRARYGLWQPADGPSADPARAYRAARTTARPHRRTR
ncbi:hypothetical protein [Streptomyces sp. N2A]|uniref:hypothetical protein n=1 Tax=Streptomyces sp. N2A TaxID=3073936 RepID=UPI00286FB7AC|nr:hypothetical protein [Streptomyces sp. N2A]